MDPILCQAASNASHSRASRKDGILTASPRSRPTSAASTISSTSITISGGSDAMSVPALSHIAVRVSPGSDLYANPVARERLL